MARKDGRAQRRRQYTKDSSAPFRNHRNSLDAYTIQPNFKTRNTGLTAAVDSPTKGSLLMGKGAEVGDLKRQMEG